MANWAMPDTPDTHELRAWLRLSLEPGLGSAQARQLLAALGLPQDIFALRAAALRKYVAPEMAHQLAQDPTDAVSQAIEHALQWLQDPGHHLLTLADHSYPRTLLDISDPPLLLYANGDTSLLDRDALAIVGARNATPAGSENALAFARHLAASGWTIVSGLALGIDAAAHDGALQAGPDGGRTVAVLGTGIDLVYPARHRDLAHRISDHGLLISELPLGTKALPWQFPRRNRLVAGLCRGVLVVEAARKSGSLITAQLAAELGREVFAIPGSIHSPLSRGCHALIRQGAKLVESAQDIHDELSQPQQGEMFVSTPKSDRTAKPRPTASPGPAPALTPTPAPTPTPTPTPTTTPAADSAAAQRQPAVDLPAPDLDTGEQTVLSALGYDPAHPDVLLQRTGMPVAQLTAILLKLELAEIVARLPDGCYQRLDGIL